MFNDADLSNGAIFGIVVLLATACVVGFRLVSHYRAGRRHRPVELAAIHESLEQSVSYDTFSDVFTTLADAYAQDPRTIRPEDSLQTFIDSDSWALGAGTEKLDKWLESAGLVAGEVRPATVLDLLLLVEEKRRGVG